MEITKIRTKGFRKFENEFETKIFNITSITGGNTKGKTNILYAIIWGFLGTNLTGDDKIWLGNINSDDCYVEIEFIDNLGEKHILTRYKNKYDNSRNFVTLDDRESDNKELSKFYGEKKLVLSILNSNYFLSKKPAEQKELLEKYLPRVSLTKIYNSLTEDEKKVLETKPRNINIYIKELNSDLKAANDKIKKINGKIEYARNIIDTTIIEDEQVFENESKLDQAKDELSFLMADNAIGDKELQQKRVNDIYLTITTKQTKLEKLLNEMKKGKETYLSIKSSNDISYCPTCNQEIKDTSKAMTISNMRKNLTEKFSNSEVLKKEIKDLEVNLMQEKCKLHSFDGLSSKEKKKAISEAKDLIKELETEKEEIQIHNSSIQLEKEKLENAKQDIETFKTEIEKQNELISSIKEAKKIAQKLHINFIEEKMKAVKKYLNKVNIKFYSILKETGEIKDDFIIQYNGNDLKNLSRSEFIACSLEISNMLNKVSKVNFPLFIDDSESCADYDFASKYSKSTQLLISQVVKGKDLNIYDYNKQESILKVA